MASPDDRTSSDDTTPVAQGRTADDDSGVPADDTGVSIPPAPPVPILPPDRVAPY